MLRRHAEAELGRGEPLDEEFDASEDVTLPYAFGLSLDLWLAWKQHGKMARAGGYLDQPRCWNTLIHLMNHRYNRQFQKAVDKEPEDYGNIWDELTAPDPDSISMSWDRLKG